MLSNILSIVPGSGGSFAGQEQSPNNYYFDNFGEPLLYALIGLLVVFVGILLIIGIIWLVGLVMRKTDNLAFLTKKREKKAKEPAKSDSDVIESVSDDDVPDEVKAAIIAAIMAYYQENEEKCEFKVKRIKRI